MKSHLQEQLGKRIQRLRKIKGFSQEAFAEKIGIATNTLSSIETGNSFMTSQTLENIIKLLNITPQELFTFKENSKKEDMYSYIQNKIKFIKDNDTYIKILYNFLKCID